MAKGVISFTVEDKARWLEIAKAKGFKNASDLARFALYQYESRYPLKSFRAVQPGPSGEKSGERLSLSEGDSE